MKTKLGNTYLYSIKTGRVSAEMLCELNPSLNHRINYSLDNVAEISLLEYRYALLENPKDDAIMSSFDWHERNFSALCSIRTSKGTTKELKASGKRVVFSCTMGNNLIFILPSH